MLFPRSRTQFYRYFGVPLSLRSRSQARQMLDKRDSLVIKRPTFVPQGNDAWIMVAQTHSRAPVTSLARRTEGLFGSQLFEIQHQLYLPVQVS